LKVLKKYKVLVKSYFAAAKIDLVKVKSGNLAGNNFWSATTKSNELTTLGGST